jgi:hypothetical protein
VAERVNDLAGDIQCQLKEKCKNVVPYSIAIDESTDVKVITQLAVFDQGMLAVVCSNISPRIEILSRSKRCQVFGQSTQ